MTCFKMPSVKSKKYKGVFYYKKNNDIVYFFRYSKHNVHIKKVIGKKSEGITELIAFEKKMQSIQDNNVNDLPFSTIATKYFDSRVIYASTIEKSRRLYQLRIVKSKFHNMPISTILKPDIQEFQKYLLQDCSLSRGTVQIYTLIIIAIYNYAIDNGYFVGRPPTKKCLLNNADVIRERFLSIEEIQLLYKSVAHDDILQLFVIIALTTGARRTSVFNIKKKDINIQNLFINIRDTKNSSTYKVFITPELFPLINKKFQTLCSQNSFLFSINEVKVCDATIIKKIKKILDALFNQGLHKSDSVNRVVVHTLRHTFASHLAIQGTPLEKIRVLLNQKNWKTTARYAKLSPDNGRDDVVGFVNSIFKTT